MENEISTENIKVEDGGVTVTPEEVQELLHLDPKVIGVKTDDEGEDEDEEQETDEQKQARETKEAEDAKIAEEKAKEDIIKADELEKSNTNKKSQEEVPKFELEIEDATGAKFILKPDDNLEEVLKDFEPKNNGQIFAVLKQLGILESEKAKYDEEQSNKAIETEKSERLSKIQSGWDSEIKALQGQKRIEVTTDGKSERVDKIFDFMREENEKRVKDGRPLIQSFEDALDKLELRETKEAAEKKAKEDKEKARKNGGLVGGSSAPASGGAPVYKGGARNSSDALRAMGILK